MIDAAELLAALDGAKTTVEPRPWGYEFVIDAEDFLLKFIHVDAGSRTSLHYHDQKDEIKFIVNADENHGSITGANDERFPGVTVRNLPGVAHRATGPLDMIEVTSHHDDVTRIADDYGRA